MQGKTNVQKVYDYLCDKPSTSQQVAEALGFNLEEVKGAIRNLKANCLVYQAVTISINGPRSIWCEIGETVSQERVDEVRKELEAQFPCTGGVKAEIYEQLLIAGPQMTCQLAKAINQNQESVRKAIQRMLKSGAIKRVGQGRNAVGQASYLYEAVPGGVRSSYVTSIEVMPIEHQKILTVRERIGRITLADQTVKAMRAAFVPGRFDPFFSLRCQLAT